MARHTFFCIDAHTCGNPVRVVAGGGPLLPAVSMAEKRQIFMRDHDWIRRWWCEWQLVIKGACHGEDDA